MALSKDELAYLDRRRAAQRGARWLWTVLALVLIGSWVAIFYFVPVLANPFHVATAASGKAFPQETVMMLVLFVPVLVGLVFALALAMVAMTASAAKNERVLLDIIANLEGEVRSKTAEPDAWRLE